MAAKRLIKLALGSEADDVGAVTVGVGEVITKSAKNAGGIVTKESPEGAISGGLAV